MHEAGQLFYDIYYDTYLHKVDALLAKYEWIATDKQYFGKPNTAYDFEANDPKEAGRRLAKLQEQKVLTMGQCHYHNIHCSLPLII